MISDILRNNTTKSFKSVKSEFVITKYICNYDRCSVSVILLNTCLCLLLLFLWPTLMHVSLYKVLSYDAKFFDINNHQRFLYCDLHFQLK